MSVSNDPLDAVVDVPDGVSRYDVVLVLIPALLLAGVAAAVVSSLAIAYGAALGAVPASGTVGYALFVDSPVESTAE
ncbi:hypothetical protein AUR64_14080 [Haloprofundus marisrubri]|uniref:Uncharacterized protein n=1 Tax=Haloprofundus marisrubri TaxID=1514971 RepID=A0A0W1R621_9EURY|nr:hypothetical protein [Haloprofundus marisrubri]KTG08934.1 hypothetical protein AUR64_14080 [Haloprofundus marisrubri]